jgi:integrase
MAKAIDAAGLSTECVLHGLRKSAAAALAEAGCSDREIMAITGHQSPRMVSHYTKSADQKRLARSAMAKREADES